jgi:hypothetical protein
MELRQVSEGVVEFVGIVVGAWFVAGLLGALMLGQVAGRAAPDEPRASAPGASAGVPRDAEIVVALHGVKKSAALVAGGLETLQTSWSTVEEQRRQHLLDVLHAHADLTARVLADLVGSADSA